MGSRAHAGPWHVIGFVEDQEKVTNFKDQENMLLNYLLDVIVEISGYMKYKYMLCICCNCVCVCFYNAVRLVCP